MQDNQGRKILGTRTQGEQIRINSGDPPFRPGYCGDEVDEWSVFEVDNRFGHKSRTRTADPYDQTTHSPARTDRAPPPGGPD